MLQRGYVAVNCRTIDWFSKKKKKNRMQFFFFIPWHSLVCKQIFLSPNWNGDLVSLGTLMNSFVHPHLICPPVLSPLLYFLFSSPIRPLYLTFSLFTYHMLSPTYLAYKAFHIGPTFVTSRSVSSTLFHSIYVATRGYLSARLPFATLSVCFFDSLRFVHCLSTQIPI